MIYVHYLFLNRVIEDILFLTFCFWSPKADLEFLDSLRVKALAPCHRGCWFKSAPYICQNFLHCVQTCIFLIRDGKMYQRTNKAGVKFFILGKIFTKSDAALLKKNIMVAISRFLVASFGIFWNFFGGKIFVAQAMFVSKKWPFFHVCL